MLGNIFTLIFIIICLYLFGSIHCNNVNLRIYKGRDALPGEFVYAVALATKKGKGTQVKSFKPFCTGSIITPVWTLTAGHCAEHISHASSKVKMVIYYAISSDDQNNQWHASDIISALVHPGFKLKYRVHLKKVLNDIGLLKTNKVLVTMLGKLSLLDFRTMYGHNVSVAGFGLTKSKKGITNVPNESLQVNEVMLIKCPKKLRGIFRPTICSTWKCKNPATMCSGDSGGPIIHRTGIVAVHTGGPTHCGKMTGLFQSGFETPISPFLDWIVSNIRNT